MRLGREGKRQIDELVLGQDVSLLDPSNLTFADLMDYFVALNRPPRTTEMTKMLLGTDPFLDGTVILLQDVVQILNRPMTAALSQDSFFLGFINRWWGALGFVCVDHPGLRVRRVRQRFGQQRLGRIGRTKRREEEIDRRPRRIDASKEVEPAAFDPDVSLTHPPGFVGRLQMRSSPLLEFRCIVLNPSPDRRMVDLHPAFNQQLLDITIRKGVAKVPAGNAG